MGQILRCIGFDDLGGSVAMAVGMSVCGLGLRWAGLSDRGAAVNSPARVGRLYRGAVWMLDRAVWLIFYRKFGYALVGIEYFSNFVRVFFFFVLLGQAEVAS